MRNDKVIEKQDVELVIGKLKERRDSAIDEMVRSGNDSERRYLTGRIDAFTHSLHMIRIATGVSEGETNG